MSELAVADGELDGVKSLVEAKKMAYAQKIEEIYHQMQDEKQSANAEDVSATAQTEADRHTDGGRQRQTGRHTQTDRGAYRGTDRQREREGEGEGEGSQLAAGL